VNDGRGLVALSLLALLGVAAARSGSKAEVEGHRIPVFALYGDFLDLEYGSPKWWTKIRNARARRRGQRFDPAMDVDVLVTETDWRKLQIARRLPPKLDERDRLIGELQRTFPPEKLDKLKGNSAKQRKLVAELQASLRAEILERGRSGSRGITRASKVNEPDRPPVLVAHRGPGADEITLFPFGKKEEIAWINRPEMVSAALLAIPPSILARPTDLGGGGRPYANHRIQKIVHDYGGLWHLVAALPSGATLDIPVQPVFSRLTTGGLWPSRGSTMAMEDLAERLGVPVERIGGSRGVARAARKVEPPLLIARRGPNAGQVDLFLPGEEAEEPLASMSELGGPDTISAALLAIPTSILIRTPDLEVPSYLRAALASSRIEKITHGADSNWHWIVLLPSGSSLDVRVRPHQGRPKVMAAMRRLAERLDVPYEVTGRKRGDRNRGSRGVARSSVSPEKVFDHKLKTALQASKKLPAPDLDPASRLTPQTWEERRLKRVVEGYIDAALDTTTDTSEDDNDDRSLSAKGYDRSALAEETAAKARRDCRDFLYLCEVLDADPFSVHSERRVGHEFWLTHNGHGAGFWDGDYEKELGDQLTKIANSFGEQWWYVGDDGQVYS